MTRILMIIGLSLLMSCTPRGTLTLDPNAGAVGDVTPVFIGTTRLLEEKGFSSKRSETVQFARYDISVPPSRTLGEINWPPRGSRADPRKHFLTTDAMLFPTEAEFRDDLAGDLKMHGGDAVIFVHGYNTNFPEGIYRVAQFAHDLELPGAVVHYAWPSAAQPLGYVFDRDSALFARDGLEAVINQVSAAGAKRILVVAHSMGSTLTMESMRQMAIRGDRTALNKISSVILISPDIDVDVFRSQAHAIGTLPQPFVIFGSDRDKVLRLSAQLTGQSERLGSLSDVSRVADLKVTFLDIGKFTEGAGHFTLGDSPALILLLDRIGDIESAFERDRVSRLGLVSGVILTVQNATQIVLTPVASVANQLQR